MPYIPCHFSRSDYLEHENLFEAVKIDDAENELCEFNNDAEDLAFELAYTRYRVAKLERAIQNCIDYANNRETEWGSRAEYAFKYLYDAIEA